MPDWVWIVGYVLAAFASIPPLARWSRKGTRESARTATFWALVCCYAWPLFLLGWIGSKTTDFLAPLIFPDDG